MPGASPSARSVSFKGPEWPHRPRNRVGADLSDRCPSRIAGKELGARMRNSAVRGQSRSERTSTVVGQSYASIMDILAPHLHAEGLRRRARLIRTVN